MNKIALQRPQTTQRVLVSLILFSALSFIIIFVTLLARADENIPADLSTSEITVSRSEVFPGQQVRYKILVRNSGGAPANVILTDTLPTGLAIIPDSLSMIGTRRPYQEDHDIITGSDTVLGNDRLEISFRALVSETISIGTELSNTVEISAAGTLLTLQAPTTVISETYIYYPLVIEPLPVPSLSLVDPTNVNNNWTIGWSSVEMSSTFKYEVQEATNQAFSNPQSWMIDPPQLSKQFNHAANWINTYYYRVRVVTDSRAGSWSNSLLVAGNYEDQFSDSNSGWAMRREDTDTVINSTYYENGHFVLRMKSSYDSLLGGPLKAAPKAPYRIETKVRLSGQDNLHAYGIVFGGDWDGTTCPNSHFSSCYNTYYRLLAMWFGDSGRLKMELKRIDYHDPVNGHARGKTLISFRDVRVNSPSEGWQTWAIEVRPGGNIKVFVNGNLVGEANDNLYIHQPFFGNVASTNEYTGLKAEYDWYKVRSLLP